MDNSPSQNMWYSFNYSYATFVSISSETDFPLAPEGLDTTFLCGPFGDQLTWLEAQLQAANANRANRPWLIVTGHRPMYSCPISDFPPDARLRLRQAMEGMFIKYKVDVYLSGHSMYSSSSFFFVFFVFFLPVFFSHPFLVFKVHGYERLYPIADGKVMNATGYNNPQAPTYIIIGNAGNLEGHATDLATNAPGSPYVAAWNAEDYGYALMTVTQSSFEWIAYRDSDGAIIDKFEIIKSP